MKINIKKLDADAVLPTRGSSQAAGYDLYAKSSEDTVILPHKTVMVGTGLAMEIPEGYFGAIAGKERIAQMVVMPYLSVEFEEVEELNETERGEGGFGSTGRK